MKFAVGFALGALVAWVVAGMYWSPIVDFWHDRFTFYKEHYTYAYEGAIDRGLLTLCERDGEVNIWFTDECDGAIR